MSGTKAPSNPTASAGVPANTESFADNTGAPMPGLEDKIMPGEDKVKIAAQGLENIKDPSKASADWTTVPHAPAKDLLVGAEGSQHRPAEGQREAGHMYSIQEHRTFVRNCLENEKGCGKFR